MLWVPGWWIWPNLVLHEPAGAVWPTKRWYINLALPTVLCVPSTTSPRVRTTIDMLVEHLFTWQITTLPLSLLLLLLLYYHSFLFGLAVSPFLWGCRQSFPCFLFPLFFFWVKTDKERFLFQAERWRLIAGLIEKNGASDVLTKYQITPTDSAPSPSLHLKRPIEFARYCTEVIMGLIVFILLGGEAIITVVDWFL